MALFDTILKEEQTSTAVMDGVIQGTSSPVSAPAQDSLIIFDAESSDPVISFATPEKPQTVSEMIMAEPVVDMNDIVLIDDTVTSDPVESKPEADVSFELSSLLAQANETVKAPIAEETRQMPSFFGQESESAKAEEPVSASESSFAIDSLMSMATEAPKTQEVKSFEDPNEILADVIARLSTSIDGKTSTQKEKQENIDALNAEIAEFNKQVAARKKQITAFNKEIEETEKEKARISDMIKLFQSQKAA